jgi:hypothetical protein
MKHRTNMALIAAALMASTPLAHEPPPARQPIKPTPRTAERLTKAEKKRARKAAQRAKLAAKASEGETER